MAYGEDYWVAVASLILYSSLFIIAIHQFYSIKNRRTSKFKDVKLIFLGLLGVSALFSLPLWGGCAILGGKNDCQWKSRSYAFCWSLHLLALVGYSSSIGIPTIMWSDIINGTDYQSFLKSFSNSNIDSTRVCFLTFVSCYAIIEMITIISMAISMSPHHMNEYFENNDIYKLSIMLEPFIICLFAGGCLFIGIRLQLYVRSVKFDEITQRRLLFQLNGVLFIVTVCYMLRSMLIFNLRMNYLPVNIPYAAWIACTHWAPQVICSFCLLTIMSRSRGSDNISTPGKYHALDSAAEGLLSPDGYTASDRSSPYRQYFEDDDEVNSHHSLTDGDDCGSSQGDTFYNQEGTNKSLSSQRRQCLSQSQAHYDLNIFNPYIMTPSDDGNESVISDDIHPINLRPDFETQLFDIM